MLPPQYRRTIRAAAAWLRAHTHTSTETHLPDVDREAIRDLVASAARYEQVRRHAPTYPEEASTLDEMIAPMCASEAERSGGPTSPPRGTDVEK